MKVKIKKYFGQHFLKDLFIAKKIVNSLSDKTKNVLEIGSGKGVLSKFLINSNMKIILCEIDNELVEYLKNKIPIISNKILTIDFLKLNLHTLFNDNFSIIGNFPYNISSQIIFKILNFNELILEIVGIFQKEVAKRIVSIHGSKIYGILSVLTQIYYKTEYLFTIESKSFYPIPKVESAAIKLKKIKNPKVKNKKLTFLIIKTAFNQRRKILKNSLKKIGIPSILSSHNFLKLRPEQLSVDNFIELINLWEDEKY